VTTVLALCRLVKPFKWWLALAGFLTVATFLSAIALAAMSAYLIAKAAIVMDLAVLALAFTSVRLFAIARAALRYLERTTSHLATFRILGHLRTWFFAAIEPRAPAILIQHRRGDLLARIIADIQTLEGFYIRVLIPPIAATLVAGGVCIFLGLFDPLFGLSVLLFLALTGIMLPFALHAPIVSASRDIVISRANLGAALVDEIEGAADLQVFDSSAAHRTSVLAESGRLKRVQERLAASRGLNGGLGTLFAALAALTVLLIGIPLVRSGQMDPVYLPLVALVALASFEAVQPMSQVLEQLAASREAGERIFGLANSAPTVTEPDQDHRFAPRDFSLEVSDVRFRYHATGPAVLDVASLRVPSGRRVAVIGTSGSGKSTLVNLLCRFWEFEAGQITLGGKDIRGYRAETLRSFLTVVPQDIHLFNASIRDNLLVANADATDRQIMDACRQALLHHFVESLPAGYDTPVGENGLLLSGGERQRLAVARMLLKDAPFVILDEPTANLDADTEERLLESIEPFLSGRTVLIISHRASVRAHVDQVLALENGRVSAV
jgi:thiol reductant ABC exporter CydC subunit